MFCFEDFDASLDSEEIRKRERLRIFRKLEILVSSCCRQLREWGLTRVADALGKCSGGEQTMKRTSEGRGAAVISSIEVVVAVAVYTPPLMALQHIWG